MADTVHDPIDWSDDGGKWRPGPRWIDSLVDCLGCSLLLGLVLGFLFFVL